MSAFKTKINGMDIMYDKGILTAKGKDIKDEIASVSVMPFSGLDLCEDIVAQSDGEIGIKTLNWVSGAELAIFIHRRSTLFGYVFYPNHPKDSMWSYMPW